MAIKIFDHGVNNLPVTNTLNNSSLVSDKNTKNLLLIEIRKYTWTDFGSYLWGIDFTPANEHRVSMQVPQVEDVNLRRFLQHVLNKIDVLDGMRKGEKAVKNLEFLYAIKNIEEEL